MDCAGLCCRGLFVFHTKLMHSGILFSILLLSLFTPRIPAVAGQEVQPAATVVFFSGLVEISNPENSAWRSAANGMKLDGGASIRTGENGRAALLLADETMVRLNKSTLFTLKKVAARAGWLKTGGGKGDESGSEYDLETGQLWLRNKNRDIHIDIKTPLVTAGIRGTELDLRIGSGTAWLSVLEGRVMVESGGGEVLANAMEQVVVNAEGAMEKKVLVDTEGSIQWVLHLPPLLTAEMAKGMGDGIKEAFLKNSLGKAGIALNSGDITGAQKILSDLTSREPDDAAAWSLYAQSLIATGDNAEALVAAQRAVALSPDSVSALLTKSLAHQALFELKEALKLAREAVEIAPDDAAARLTCARLLFAMDDMKGTRQQLEAVSNAEAAAANNLLGFIHYANNDTGAAVSCFEKALAVDPSMAEAYMGLGLARMRLGDRSAAVEAVFSAILLEPRRSLFMSYLGKMLHEMGRPQKALEVLAQAVLLDGADPTPWLYRAHILQDLNRSGEAIEAYQQAVQRNDNRAVYRSRFLLDKDLAVKNVSMARLFWKLGMGDWGRHKAWQSVKLDYANSAAHDFEAWVMHYTSGDVGSADTSEWLKAFLFKPANDNTFNNFTDYTLFFEQPDFSGQAGIQYGTHDLKLGSATVFGALPEKSLSFRVDAEWHERDQWRGGLYEKGYMFRPSIKWDVTPRDHLSFRTHIETADYGDIGTVSQYEVAGDPLNRSTADYGQIEAGYYKEISPKADFLVHVRHRFDNDYDVEAHERIISDGMFFDAYSDITLGEPYTTLQALQLFRVGDHQMMAGTFQYWSDRSYQGDDNVFLDLGGTPLPIYAFQSDSGKTRRQESYYLQDVWRVSPFLTLEGSLYADRIENVNSAVDTDWSENYLHPRVGVIFTPTPAHTLTFAHLRYLDTLQFAARIDSIEVAGQPLASFYEGAVFEETAVGWTYEWSSGCLITRAFDLAMTIPVQEDSSEVSPLTEYDYEYQGVEMSYNQVLGRRFGLNLGYIYLDVVKDAFSAANESRNQVLYGRLSYLNPSGFYCGLLQHYYMARYDENPEKRTNDFPITSIYLGYELPEKRGDIRLDVLNLFEEKFNGEYLSDLSGYWPDLTARLQVQYFF